MRQNVPMPAWYMVINVASVLAKGGPANRMNKKGKEKKASLIISHHNSCFLLLPSR